MLTVRPMLAADMPLLRLQKAQQWFLGPELQLDEAYGASLLAAGPAWTVLRADGSILACCGYGEHNARYASCWSLLAEGLGRDHLALTRIVRERIAAAPYDAIDALVRADHPAALRWARLVGLTYLAHLRRRGPGGEDYVAYERIAPLTFADLAVAA